MIVYFTDRRLNVLGLASSEIATGFAITEDKKTESIENGVVTFDVTIAYEQETKETLESYCEAGNYLFRSTGGEAEFYTIIDEETDSADQTITLYCEDAGMDLLNGVAGAFKADAAHPIAWYFDQWIKGTGFEIGVNEISSLSRKLEWDGESTITERLASVATQFDNAEVSYSFEIDRLKVSKMYVNIFKKRGANKAVKLRMGREISNIKIKKSVADIATALKCTGGTPEGKEAPITLNGYKFDDGDFYVDGDKLCCRSALKRWGRLGTNQHIVKTYSYDTSSQSELCAHAVTKLKSIKDTAFSMSADIIRLPDGVGVGDRVIIVDDEGKTYVSTRLLTLEKSVLTGSIAATLGDYIQQDAGISAQVQELAEKFAAIATSKADALAAAKAAEEARKKAEAAKSAADSATNTANTATSTANAAKDTADAANSTAGQAKATANTAKSTAETARKKAEAAKSTADNANSKIDNLKVGGRNLLVGRSGLEQTFSYPSSGLVDHVRWNGLTLPPETDFTLSFDAKASDAGNIMRSQFWNPSNLTRTESSQGTVSGNGSGFMRTKLTTEWKRYWIHYTGPVAASRNVIALRLQAGDGTGTVSIRKIKFEVGNKATDWTPAPEDIDATTDQLRDDLNSTESALNTQINEVSKKTDSTNSALNAARDELSKRIADTMAQAQMAAAAAKVAQTDLDNYKSMTVDPQLKTMSDFMAKYNLSFRQDSTGLYITNQNADGTTADISLRLGNDRISFIQGTGDAAYEVAFISNNQLYITSGEFLKGLRLGNYALIPGANGNLSCKKVK